MEKKNPVKHFSPEIQTQESKNKAGKRKCSFKGTYRGNEYMIFLRLPL